MIIQKAQNGGEMRVALEGRLDTTTAPELEAELSKDMENVQTLIFDFDRLVYISSAGLRVLLAAQKMMNRKNGSMKVIHVNEIVQEVFDVTGFSDILTIE